MESKKVLNKLKSGQLNVFHLVNKYKKSAVIESIVLKFDGQFAGSGGTSGKPFWVYIPIK